MSGPKLHRYLVIDTDDGNRISETLISQFGASEVDFLHDQPIRGVVAHLPLESIELCYVSFSAGISVKFPASHFVRQPFVESGVGSIQFNRRPFEIRLSTTDSGVIPAGVEFSCRHPDAISQLILRLDAAALRSKLSSLIGRPIGRHLDFASPSSFNDPLQARLRHIVEFLVSELDNGSAEWPETAFADLQQFVLMSFLAAHSHNFIQFQTTSKANAAPWQVAVVEEFIEANWHRSVTIEEISAVTGVGVRAMFRTFGEYRGYSPMAFMKQVRLQHARRMLQSPDDKTSVVAVSLACGFHNGGHFARYYREAFKELPADTLRKARSNVRGRGN